MFRTDVWATLPGLTDAVVTYEAAFAWGPDSLRRIAPALISANAQDPTNAPTTFELRPGLLMGQIAASGQWTNYNPTATDGSEVAAGINLTSIRMTDIITNTGQQRFYGLLVGGAVQAQKIIGLDLMARQQMGGTFWFDDNLGYPGCHWFRWKRFQSKAANYQILAQDNFSLFDNTGAAGAVTFTLPPLANGYQFSFRGAVAQNITVSSFEGGNLVGLNNAAANTATFSTGGELIGAQMTVFSNPAGTKWLVLNESAGAATITLA